MYYEAEYEQRCVTIRGPAECLPYRDKLSELRRQATLANSVYQIGPMPKTEKAQLEAQIAAIQVVP